MNRSQLQLNSSDACLEKYERKESIEYLNTIKHGNTIWAHLHCANSQAVQRCCCRSCNRMSNLVSIGKQNKRDTSKFFRTSYNSYHILRKQYSSSDMAAGNEQLAWLQHHRFTSLNSNNFRLPVSGRGRSESRVNRYNWSYWMQAVAVVLPGSCKSRRQQRTPSPSLRRWQTRTATPSLHTAWVAGPAGAGPADKAFNIAMYCQQ